jgi:hypothetical protein
MVKTTIEHTDEGWHRLREKLVDLRIFRKIFADVRGKT